MGTMHDVTLEARDEATQWLAAFVALLRREADKVPAIAKPAWHLAAGRLESRSIAIADGVAIDEQWSAQLVDALYGDDRFPTCEVDGIETIATLAAAFDALAELILDGAISEDEDTYAVVDATLEGFRALSERAGRWCVESVLVSDAVELLTEWDAAIAAVG